MYQDYLAHGLAIVSEVTCPEMAPHPRPDGPPDAWFHFGRVADALDGPANDERNGHARQKRFRLNVEGVARYLVRDGREIIVEPAPGSAEDDVRVFLLGSALGALLHQRGRFVLHGSAIETARGAVVFVGPSGIGKSTLATAFYTQGYRILTDDLCSLDVSEQAGIRVFPGKAEIKLWRDSAEALGFDPDTMRPVQRGWSKYAQALNGAYPVEPAPLHAVYRLASSDSADYAVHSLSRVEQFQVLLDNTYRAHFLKDLAVEARHFKQASTIAQQVTIARIVRPTTPLNVRVLASFVQSALALTPTHRPDHGGAV